ncbi:hypothetical protein Ahy_B06g081035 [Arachis hypogaea]|uniref:Aminotransferase-like plant mobile domain-containing protein n=1 Tax=Arachis hypogaea TaxID=3818 RepID=A0A444YJW8_ARAHY|nr:hypothetical protein Ahy_B06g081035 [Arachis hypogaea]
MRRQQGMRLDEIYIPYLQMAGLYHLARLDDRWFRLDEPLVSALVEQWRPETHTFHMSFGECTITLQDVAYQLGLPDRFSDIHPGWPSSLGVVPGVAWSDSSSEPSSEIRSKLHLLFADKSSNRIHIRWLPYVARLEEMGGYSWGSATLAWLYRFRPAGFDTCSWPLALSYNTDVRCKWSGYNPSGSEKGPRVQMWRLRIDILQARDFIWMPYSSPNVLQVVHPEVLEPRHMALWRSVTPLIYFALIEWHQIDRVLPQFGGVQPRPQPALNIDFLMSKDGRGDPGPSHDLLEWWSQHGKRFLSPEMYLGDPRAVPIPMEATHRGAGLCTNGEAVGDCLREFQTWYQHSTWDWVEELLDARSPHTQQEEQKESFSIKLT